MFVQRTLLISLFIGVILLAVKFYAYFITQSNTILSDALESIVNVAAGFMAYWAYGYSLKPQDEDHPYGHGKIEFLSSGLEAMMITTVGMSLIIKATYNIYSPQVIDNIHIGLILTTLSGIINYLLGHMIQKQGFSRRSVLLEANGQHLKMDAYTSFALIIGLAITYLTQTTLIDNIVAIGFSFFIIFTGVQLAQKSLAGILDERDDHVIDELIRKIQSRRKTSWIDLHNLRITKHGSRFHIDCHITMPWYYSVEKSHAHMEEFQDEIKRLMPNTHELFVHVDPCIESSCSICDMTPCKERKRPFVKKVVWAKDNVTSNQKHHINL